MNRVHIAFTVCAMDGRMIQCRTTMTTIVLTSPNGFQSPTNIYGKEQNKEAHGDSTLFLLREPMNKCANNALLYKSSIDT